MKFIHLSDLHLVPPGEKLWGFDPLARLDACLTDIATHHSDAAFCAISGDLAERGEIAAYEALKARLERFPLKILLMLGNHDDRANYIQVFGEQPRDENGFIQHSKQLNDIAVLCLDTLKGPPSSAGLYCDERRAWLKTQLSELNGKPAVTFMHHPPFDIGHELMDLIKL